MSVRGRESELAVDCVVLMISAASEKFRAFNQPNSICKQSSACFAQSHLIKGIELFFKKRGSWKKRL